MPPQDEGLRTPLSDHVRTYLERAESRGVSKNRFVTSCVDPLNPTKQIYGQWLDALLDGRGPMPELWRLRALAAGMGADPEALKAGRSRELEELKRMAAAQWLEYEVEEIRHGDDVIILPVRNGLSEAARRRVRRVAEAALAAEEDEEGD
ncbi:hypothetical protein ACFFMN_33705 [Planobispora siamensis]|uniref:Uncharacterized protein n=1 Tax=Planobispora siamensis TaxID=936338 RepID=A0A8J3SLX0_9ACTN|nr:hypothetical protein [Planobispora siamensis]GIH91993.1 hypothetical protein Psi01_26230 [Planobispora siamensis]